MHSVCSEKKNEAENYMVFHCSIMLPYRLSLDHRFVKFNYFTTSHSFQFGNKFEVLASVLNRYMSKSFESQM